MVNKVWNLDKFNQMNIYQMNKNVQDKLLTGVKVFSKRYKKTKGKKMTDAREKYITRVLNSISLENCEYQNFICGCSIVTDKYCHYSNQT